LKIPFGNVSELIKQIWSHIIPFGDGLLVNASGSFIFLNTFTASIFWVFHQFSKGDGEFNSMNIQRRNVSSERILILFSNTTDLFSIAVSKEFVIKFREKLIFHQKSGENAIFLRHFQWF
jgi:hypothetical protein